jgi:transcriptional regulator with XRE-family HTH domain
MKRSKETFKFTDEMGARLRELRLKAGVTQQELAVLMGRKGKGNAFLISRFESGHIPYPSFGFVADYLRACKSSFNDIADLLSAYTSQPTVIEQRGYKRVRSLAKKLPASMAKAVENYDHGVTRSMKKPEPPRQRARNAKAYADAQETQRQLNQLVEGAIGTAHLGSVSPEAAWLRVYARKLYRLLKRTNDPSKLRSKLEDLERWATDTGLGTLEVLAALRGRIAELSGRPFRD